MQDFDLGSKVNKNVDNAMDTMNHATDTMNHDGELTMTVSPVCLVEGQKKAFVNFTDGKRNAEGEIPDCIIRKYNGFTEAEKVQLEEYMKANLTMLKKMAANIDILAAMMK